MAEVGGFPEEVTFKLLCFKGISRNSPGKEGTRAFDVGRAAGAHTNGLEMTQPLCTLPRVTSWVFQDGPGLRGWMRTCTCPSVSQSPPSLGVPWPGDNPLGRIQPRGGAGTLEGRAALTPGSSTCSPETEQMPGAPSPARACRELGAKVHATSIRARFCYQ